MNCRTISLLLVLISPAFAYAQPNFKKSYVITLQGDTLHGYIDQKERTKTPTQFYFKKDLEAKATEVYTVRNAQKIGIETNESYERFAVSLSMNEVNFSRLELAGNPADKTDTVFLEVIAAGDKLNLYLYRDKLKDRFYTLVPPQTTPEELNFSIHMENGNLTASYAYRRQLDLLASPYATYTPQLKNEIASASYSGKELKKIVNKINGVDETKRAVDRKDYKRGRFFATAGINCSSVTYKGKNLINANGPDKNGYPAYKDATTTHSYMPVVSAGYDFYFHPRIKRSYLRTEGAATAIRSEVNSFYKFPPPYDEELTIRYKLFGIFLSLTPQLGYNVYQQRNLSIHVGGGPSLRYSFYPTQTFNQRTNKQGPGYSDVTIENYFKMKNLSVIPMVHAGAIINKKAGVSVSWFMASKLVTIYDDSKYSSVKTGSVHINVAFPF